jgi:hypothetical protein
MPLLPACLSAACPWCAAANVAPVPTPMRELDRWLERRCSSCGGGMRARTSWEAFACFAFGYGLLSDATLLVVHEGYLSNAIGIGGLTVWLALFALGTFVLTRFLLMNASMRRGVEPVVAEAA